MLWVHAAWCTMRTICMSAYMRRNLRHLYFIDFIALLYNMLKIFLPMQGNHRHLILIQVQKSTLPPTIGSTFGFLRFWIIRLKHSQTSSCIGITRLYPDILRFLKPFLSYPFFFQSLLLSAPFVWRSPSAVLSYHTKGCFSIDICLYSISIFM